MIYFNVAGLSPFNQQVQQEVTATLKHFSQLLYSDEGIHFYRETVQQCRQDLAQWLHLVEAQHLAFVPNATTASRFVLSRIHWKPDDHILTTNHENATVLKEILSLQTQSVHVDVLDPSSPEDLENHVAQLLSSTQVRAIVISHVSHFDGRIFPIERIYQLTRKNDVFLVVDGAQAVGHIPVSFHDWQPDAYFFPGHKWCAGPMGTGALILGKLFAAPRERESTEQPLWADFELGTQNIGLIAGLAKACTLKQQKGLQTDRLESYREKVRKTLAKNSQYKILEWNGPQSPGILSITSPKAQNQSQLQSKSGDITWKTFQPPNNQEQPGIRLSWSSDTSETDVESLLSFFRT